MNSLGAKIISEIGVCLMVMGRGSWVQVVGRGCGCGCG